MKNLIYIFILCLLFSCSKDDDGASPGMVNATIKVSGSNNLEYARYKQLEEGNTTKWYWKEMVVDGREAKENTQFRKGFETRISVQGVVRNQNIYITVHKDGKVVLDDTFFVPDYNPSVYWDVQF